MPPVGFEPTIQASARPQTYALDRAVTGIGVIFSNYVYFLAHTAPVRLQKNFPSIGGEL
jgi:hypothetical protein